MKMNYQTLKDKHHELFLKKRKLERELRDRDKYIEKLKEQIGALEKVIEQKNKGLKEYELLIGWLIDDRPLEPHYNRNFHLK